MDRNNLFVATKNVNDVAAQDAAREESGMRIIPVVAMPESIDAAIDRLAPEE